MKHKAKTVCQEAVARCTATFESDFVLLDKVLHLSSATVGRFIEERWLGAFQTGDHKAEILAHIRDFGHYYHSSWFVPAPWPDSLLL